MKTNTPKHTKPSTLDREQAPEPPEWLVELTPEERRQEALELIRLMNSGAFDDDATTTNRSSTEVSREHPMHEGDSDPTGGTRSPRRAPLGLRGVVRAAGYDPAGQTGGVADGRNVSGRIPGPPGRDRPAARARCDPFGRGSARA